MPEPRLILASASPRRHELLAQCGCAFTVSPADVDEAMRAGEAATDYVQRVAADKALAIWRQSSNRFVLGADTVVLVDGRMLGKPEDDHEARRMLRALSDRTHQVASALILVWPDGACRRRLSVTEVSFGRLPDAWIDRYVRSGAGRDKAGAYGIQNEAGLWVRHISGSYSGVVGLPLFETADLLREAGLL